MGWSLAKRSRETELMNVVSNSLDDYYAGLKDLATLSTLTHSPMFRLSPQPGGRLPGISII
jgi:hypothetical protein